MHDISLFLRQRKKDPKKEGIICTFRLRERRVAEQKMEGCWVNHTCHHSEPKNRSSLRSQLHVVILAAQADWAHWDIWSLPYLETESSPYPCKPGLGRLLLNRQHSHLDPLLGGHNKLEKDSWIEGVTTLEKDSICHPLWELCWKTSSMRLFLTQTLQPNIIWPSFVLLYQFISGRHFTHSLIHSRSHYWALTKCRPGAALGREETVMNKSDSDLTSWSFGWVGDDVQ